MNEKQTNSKLSIPLYTTYGGITRILWAVKLSWLDNAYSRQLFSAADFDP